MPGAVSPYLFQMNNLKYSKQTRIYELQKENEWQGEGGIANLLAYQQVAILIEFFIPRRWSIDCLESIKWVTRVSSPHESWSIIHFSHFLTTIE